MSDVIFTQAGWAQYQSWHEENNRRVIKKIRDLVKDIERNGNRGIGKPEPLKGDMEGWWSRRITDEHRLVYRIDGDVIKIVKCRNHYN
jgi:toxin YoeB